MNILIDGAIFDYGFAALEEARLWDGLIPRIVSRLHGAQVYFINRGSAIKFQKNEGIIPLYAPSYNYSKAAIENSRLEALCREYGVEIFFSTYHTSATSNINSLYLDFSSNMGSHGPALASARKYAALSAVSHLVLQHETSIEIEKLTRIPRDMVTTAYSPRYDGQICLTTLSNLVVKTLLYMPRCPKSAHLNFLRIQAEKEMTLDRLIV